MSQVVARAEAPEIAGVVDPVWAKLRQEAEAAIRQEPSLTSFILTMILNHDTLESAVAHRVAARLGHPMLYFKGFHALETHRLAHWLWQGGRHDFALYLQSRSSEVFQTDINPAARIGRGIFLDHATGLVVGATAVV